MKRNVSDTPSLSRQAIYRNVARQYEQTKIATGTCDALHKEFGRWEVDYASLFAPEELGECGPSSFERWNKCISFGDQLREIFGVDDAGEMSSQRARDFRILALCFMAAMIERGDA